MKTKKALLSAVLSLSMLFSVSAAAVSAHAADNDDSLDAAEENVQDDTHEETQPVQPLEYTIDGLDEYNAYYIMDGVNSTASTLDQFDFTIKCETPFSYAYVVWNSPPGDYTIELENNAVKVDDSYIHKLIALDSPTNSVAFKCEGGGALTNIYLFDSDNFPDYVQQWQPPCEQADIIVFSTHADDEYLMFGGTIPYYAKELGLNVQVCYTTTHFHQQPRPHELLDALWFAGVRNYPVFGVVADTWLITTIEEAQQHFDFDAVRGWIVEQIRRFKPSVIVTHDINGEYGHGAHKMTSQLTMEAVEISFNPDEYSESAEKYGVWDVPKTYIHFWQENAIEMDWEIPLESFGGITAREAAQQCFEIHKSQTIYPEFYVGYQPYYDCRQFGLYRTLVGVDEKADFMDHITPIAETTTVPETEPVTEPVTESDATEPVTEAETEPVTVDISETEVTEDTETAVENQKSGNAAPIVIVLVVGAAAVIGAVVLIYTKRSKKSKK